MTPEQRHFQALTLPFLDRLFSAAQQQLGSRQQAEDLVQETYLNAWRAFTSLEDEARVYPWLYCIMRRELADYYRRRGRRNALVSITSLEAAATELLQADGTDPLEHTLAALGNERMAHLMRLMPEVFAEALVLHDVEGFAYREIADITKAPIGTVMSRISRARRLLAGLVHQYRDTSDQALRQSVDGLEHKEVGR